MFIEVNSPSLWVVPTSSFALEVITFWLKLLLFTNFHLKFSKKTYKSMSDALGDVGGRFKTSPSSADSVESLFALLNHKVQERQRVGRSSPD